jgi:hypothetical protein
VQGRKIIVSRIKAASRRQDCVFADFFRRFELASRRCALGAFDASNPVVKRILIYLTMMALGICRADVPKLFTEKPFNSVTLAEAVNHYVAIGEPAAIVELQQLAAQEKSDNDFFASHGFCLSERIAWVCRILYEPRGHSPLRAPKFGTLSIPERTMPLEKWPLYPVAVSGSTYVVLNQSYTPKGKLEDITHYLAYCKDSGAFRKNPVAVPTQEQAMKDAAAIRQSEPWQAIKWKDDDGFSYPMGEQWTWGFIQNQARTIPVESVATKKPSADAADLSVR